MERIKNAQACPGLMKDSLSVLLHTLQEAEKEKGNPLTGAEETEVVRKEIRRIREEMDNCGDKTLVRKLGMRRKFYKKLVPRKMSKLEIHMAVAETLSRLEMEKPAEKDRQKITETVLAGLGGYADRKDVDDVINGFIR